MFVMLMTEIWNEPGVRLNVVGVADKRKPGEVPDVACAVIGKVTESTSIDVRINTEVEDGTVGFAHRDSNRIRKPFLPTCLPLNLHSIDDRTWVIAPLTTVSVISIPRRSRSDRLLF
jgi:hypothetical protein